MNAPATEKERQHRTTATLTLELEPPNSAPEPPPPTQNASEYKKHSLAAQYWGGIAQSRQPIRQVAAPDAQATFVRGMLDMPTDHKQKNPTDWIISVAVHVLIVTAIVIAPLAFTQAIDLRAFQLTYLTMPKPPAAAPPPSAPAAVQQAARRVIRAVRSALVAPTLIPRRIEMVKDAPAPDVSEGVVGGIPGGESGGVLGGILGGTERGPAAPAIAPPAQKKVYRVGGDVKPPRELKVVPPVYSPIAQQAHTEGVVIIDAVIDEHGDVVEARAVSGPGLLIPEALKAVIQWKYEPTYLDGQPVPIRMEVQVHFRLH
ncbi:MAG TPA: energy transducer TonB [Candidatus Acidoferrales bacterium]|nr:energy transducer TonB [Candidatus Acidoferrales bacterium]